MNIFFFCIGNLCCLILVEVIFNYLVLVGWEVMSVGSKLIGQVYFCFLVLLVWEGIFIEGYCSKFWENLLVTFDIVVMVCFSVVGEVCLVYLGVVVCVYWGVEDLVYVSGSDEEIDVVFMMVYCILWVCIEVFLVLLLVELV